MQEYMAKNIVKFTISKSTIIFTSSTFFVLFIFLSLSSTALSAPPDSPYVPGETLNPSCSPGDSNCSVVQITIATTTNNFGVGTTSPYAKLSVSGQVVAASYISTTTATSTFGGGLNISTGCFSISNTCIGSGSSQWTTTGYNIYYNTGSVGVGTTTPYAKLSVVGEVVATNFTATSTTATSTFMGGLEVTGTGLQLSATTKVYQGGQNFLISSTTSAGNLSIGYQSASGLDSSGGLYSTFMGYQAGRSATSSAYNTGVGYQTLNSVVKGNGTAGGYNTASGYQALRSNTTGYTNTAIGASSLTANTTGFENTSMGYLSMSANLTGQYNVAIGNNALQTNTSGHANTSIGYQSSYFNNVSTRNTAIGYQAGYGASGQTASQHNVFLGYQAGLIHTTGSNNTLIGYKTGDTLTSGSNNIVLGYDIDVLNATGDNTLNIGNIIFGTNIDGTGSTLSTGKIGIGTTSPYAKLSVDGEVVATNFTATSTTATSTFAGGLDVTGTGIQLSATTKVYQGGQNFLISSTSAAGNLSIGYQSASDLDSSGGLYSTFIGYQAGQSATSSVSNTGVGYQALKSVVFSGVSGGSNNTSFGYQTLQSNTTGSDNAGFGFQALNTNSTGQYNIALGGQAMYSNSTGLRNVGVGYNSLYLSNNAAGNTTVGYQAGYNLTSGSYNLILGHNVGAPSASGDQQLNIGNLIYGTSLYNGGSVSSVPVNGKIGIGTTSPYAKLSVVGEVVATNFTATSTNATSTFSGGLQVGGTTGLNVFANSKISIGTDVYAGNELAKLYINTGNISFTDNYGMTWDGSFPSGIYGASGASGYIALNPGNSQVARFDRTGGLTLGSNFVGTPAPSGGIISEGSVGIGTTTPYAKLSVVGEVAATNFTATSTTATSTVKGGFWSSGASYFTNNFSIGNGVMVGQDLTLDPILFEVNTSAQRVKIGDVNQNANGLQANFSLSNITFRDITESATILDINTISGGYEIIMGNKSTFLNQSISTSTFNSGAIFATTRGGVGIGSSTPSARLSISQIADSRGGGIWQSATDGDYRATYMDTTGILNFNGGDGGTINTATLNAAGAWTNASDRSYKENIVDLNTKYNLGTILSLNPRFYTMKGSGLPQIGFIAQEVNAFISEVVDGQEGSMGISYGNLASLSFQGIKDLATVLNIQTTSSSTPESLTSFTSVRLDEIERKITDLQNDQGTSGVQDILDWVRNSITAITGKFTELISEKIVVENLIVGSSLKPSGITIFSKSGNAFCLTVDDSGTPMSTVGECGTLITTTAPSTTPANPSDTTPPIITIIGNNPAEIEKGTPYVDLGATVDDDVDHNLGISTSGNIIDTSVSGTYPIIYTATDSAGNSASTTRSVIISDPVASEETPPTVE